MPAVSVSNRPVVNSYHAPAAPRRAAAPRPIARPAVARPVARPQRAADTYVGASAWGGPTDAQIATGGAWMVVGYLLCFTIIGIPIGLPMIFGGGSTLSS